MIIIIKVITNGKNFYDQAIDSDIKGYNEIRKLTTGQGENYTTGCLLDYDYIKNHYWLIVVDLNRQNKLNADPITTQQIEFIGQLKTLDANYHATDAGSDQSMFILIILEKLNKKKSKIFWRKCKSIINNCKLSGSKS